MARTPKVLTPLEQRVEQRRQAERQARARWEADRDLLSGILRSVVLLRALPDGDPGEYMNRLKPGMFMSSQERDNVAANYRTAAARAILLAEWMETNPTRGEPSRTTEIEGPNG